MTILEFQARAVRQLSRPTIVRMLRNLPKFDDWSGLLLKINKLDAECMRYKSIIASERSTATEGMLMNAFSHQKRRLAKLIQRQDDKEEVVLSVTLLISDIMIGQDHEDVRSLLGAMYWDTGRWLLQHPDYVAWTESRSDLIWLRGPVGVGKTCLTSIVIQQNLSIATGDQVAFFYCSQQQMEAVDILRSILAQFACDKHGKLIAHVKRWFERSTGYRARPSSNSLRASRPITSRNYRPSSAWNS